MAPACLFLEFLTDAEVWVLTTQICCRRSLVSRYLQMLSALAWLYARLMIVQRNLNVLLKKDLKDGDSLMEYGKLKDAMPFYERAMDKLFSLDVPVSAINCAYGQRHSNTNED